MNYTELTLQEKTQKAIEYALILASDERPDLDIVSELMQMFDISEEQAKRVYILMRKQHDEEYRKAVRSTITNLWMAIISFGTIMFAFLFLGGVSIAIFLISAFLWGAVLVMMVHFLALKYRDINTSPEDGYFLERERQLNLKNNKKDKSIWTLSLPIFFLILSILSFYAFFYNQGSVTVNKTMVPAKLMTVETVKLLNTGSKTRHSQMEFRFVNSPHRYRLDEDIFNYGVWKIETSQFSYGDAIRIQVTRNGFTNMERKSEAEISLKNISVNGRWLVDHTKRNAEIQKENKGYLILLTGLFFLSVIITAIWFRYRKTKYKNISTVVGYIRAK